MKKYIVTLEALLVETVEAENAVEAQQEAIEKVNIETGNNCEWLVTEIIEKEE